MSHQHPVALRISLETDLLVAAKARAAEINQGFSAYICDLIDRDLRTPHSQSAPIVQTHKSVTAIEDLGRALPKNCPYEKTN